MSANNIHNGTAIGPVKKAYKSPDPVQRNLYF